MKRRRGYVCCPILAAVAVAAASVATGKADESGVARREVVVEGVRFSVAEGLQLEKVAGEPLVKWPIVADWDDEGRLVVAESGGVGWPIQEHNEKKLHRIVRLVDRDGDGTFDERILAADQLAFPEGVLCVDDSILVAAPPVIWELIDADGDGYCEDRRVWFDGQTVTNCANDLHGPYLGPDGWVYWCKGAFGEQTHELTDGRMLRSRAAHVFRRRLEGGPIEPVVSGGMDNPVEAAFLPEGEMFFTSTFLQQPGDGLRDGIAHGVYGGLFGKDHDVIDGHPRTGPLMPIMTQLGPAAPSGLACLRAPRLLPTAWIVEPGRTLVAASFNLHRLTAHRLLPVGATYRSVDLDLVSTDRVDFHPTDVLEDADGSLLLVDTGGWYDLCCPTSRIDQTTAAGGIYRVSADRLPDPPKDRTIEWDSLDLDAVVCLLWDERPWIRRRASLLLAGQGDRPVAALDAVSADPTRNADERLAAVWALCRIGTPAALEASAARLQDPNPSLQRAACHVVAIHRDAARRGAVRRLLEHPEPAVRRAAAEALGRLGGREEARAVLRAISHEAGPGGTIADRHLEHSLLYALIEIARRDQTIGWETLPETDAARRAVILVLDQAGRSETLEPEQLFAAIDQADGPLRATAAEVLARHPEWAAEFAGKLEAIWREARGGREDLRGVLRTLVIGWRGEAAMQDLVRSWIDQAPTYREAAQQDLATLLPHAAAAKVAPASWAGPLADWLEAAPAAVRASLLGSLSEVDWETVDRGLAGTLERLARSDESLPQRMLTLAAVPAGHRLKDRKLESAVVAALSDPSQAGRRMAAEALQRLRLSASGAGQLVDRLGEVSPSHLAIAVEAVRRAADEPTEHRMLDELVNVPAAKTLPQDFLRERYRRASAPLRDHAGRTQETLLRPSADVEATVTETLARLGPGDPVRGLQVFRSERAACSACHRMGYIGNDVGPVLTRIGASRTPEALLEAILFPSARQEQSYQSSRILTVDGRILTGLIRDRDGESVELQFDAQRREAIPAENIERLEPSDVSVMPSGLTELLSDQDLADLLALLRSAR